MILELTPDVECLDCGDVPGLGLLALFIMSMGVPALATAALTHLLVVSGLVAGAVYGGIVHLSRGHTGILWGLRVDGMKRWRTEWLGLAMIGYLLGLFTFIVAAWRTTPGFIVGIALLLASVFAAYRSIDPRARSDHSPRVFLVAAGLMIIVAWIAGGPQLGLLETNGSRELLMWAVIWTLGATLTAIEVWRVGSIGGREPRFRRWRRLLPAG